MVQGRQTSAPQDYVTVYPLYVFGSVLAYLFIAWLISYLGDVHNFLGLTDRLVNRGAERPFMWYYLFMEGSPTEMMQWLYLSATAVVSALLAGKLYAARYQLPARFFLLFSSGVAIMLMEDAGNLRHQIKYFVRLALGDTMAVGIAVELVFFGFLGLFMLYILLRYGRYIWHERTTRGFLLVGYFSYAAATLASGTRHFADWYDHAGNWLLQVFGLYEPFNAIFVPTDVGRPIGFYVMDFLIEESVELLAVGALCTAAFAYLHAFTLDQHIARVEEENRQ